MFRLRILSEIEVQNYLRSNQVTKSHQRSNKGQIRPIGVESARLVEIYQIYICFDSEFCRKSIFKIFYFHPSQDRPLSVYTLVQTLWTVYLRHDLESIKINQSCLLHLTRIQ